ncbi:hypothetical protein B4U79_16532 [Dinothrombium tinctorium]|uniref:DNA primase/polymerase bifunctional N-terminal domain-containing protein n=1 Tax=Dinothrombium tinctorium TaxID=1965070 RepID=A0A443QJP4_9ACAR|nr:hypothetical protein B4U79_16532 [Dinothrombium tinctorium]
MQSTKQESTKESCGQSVVQSGAPGDVSSVEPFSRRIESMVSYPCKQKIPQVKEWNKLKEKKPHAPGTQFGLLCGKTNGFLVVDCDLLKNSDPKLYVDGLYAWNEWIKQHGDVCAPRVKTGSGGLHVYFCYDSQVPDFCQQLEGKLVSAEHDGKKIKIDVLTNEKNVIAPGSPGYEYLTEEDKLRPLVPLPEWLKEILMTTSKQQHAKKKHKLETKVVPEKKRKLKQHSKFEATNDNNNCSTSTKHSNNEGSTIEGSTIEESSIEGSSIEGSGIEGSSIEGSSIEGNGSLEVSWVELAGVVNELDASLAEPFDSWSRVLWAICSTARKNHFTALDIAVLFSKKCPAKFRGEEDVRKVYEKADGRLGFGYLVWLSVDDIEFRDSKTLMVSYTDEQGSRGKLRIFAPYAAVYAENVNNNLTTNISNNNNSNDDDLSIGKSGNGQINNKSGFLCFLTNALELEQRLGIFDKRFQGRCVCYLRNENEFDLRCENDSSMGLWMGTVSNTSRMTLVNPMHSGFRYIHFEQKNFSASSNETKDSITFASENNNIPLVNLVPDSMKDWKNLLCAESDEVAQWLEERISVTRNKEHVLTQEEVYQRLKMSGIKCLRTALTPKWKAFAERHALEYRAEIKVADFGNTRKKLHKVLIGVNFE